jgi:hypothetical protein
MIIRRKGINAFPGKLRERMRFPRFQRTLDAFYLAVLSWLRSNALYVSVVIAYILLTIMFTWPLAQNFTSFVNGNVMDVFHELWYLHLGSTNPTGPFFLFYTNSILYPYGVPLFFQVISPFNTLLFGLLTSLFGEIVAYNLLYMFTFVAAAFNMFILTKYLTKNKYAAFFAGIIFGFAPVHTGQGLSHLNIMSAEFVPLYAYFLIRLGREQRFRNALYAGALIVLNAMCDLHMLLIVLFITASYLLYSLFVQRREILNKPFLHRLFIMTIFSAILLVVVYFQTIFAVLFTPPALGQSAAAKLLINRASIGGSSDLLEFFTPGPENPILGRYTLSLYSNFSAFPQVRTYIGWSALTLAILGLIANRKRSVWFWGFLSIVGALLAIGPFVQIDGKVTEIPGLWLYLYYLVPLFQSFRAPYRLDYLVMLGVGVLAAYGLSSAFSALEKRFKKRNSSRTIKIVVLAILCAILIVEFLPTPYPELYAKIPSFYTQVLAKDHSNYAVLEVPVTPSASVYLYYQSAYNHPLVDGSVSRTPQSSASFREATPFINELGAYNPTGYTGTNLKGKKAGGGAPAHDIINETINVIQVAPYILTEFHIKYIIVHASLLTAQQYVADINLISSVVGPPIYQDNAITAFEWNPPANMTGMAQYPINYHMAFFSLLYGGWYPYGGLKGRLTRAMSLYAGLLVYSSSNQYMELEFNARGIFSSYPLQLVVNNQIEGTYYVRQSVYNTYATPFIYVHQGLNVVYFYSVNGCNTAPLPNPAVSGKSAVIGGTIDCASAQFRWIATIPAVLS